MAAACSRIFSWSCRRVISREGEKRKLVQGTLEALQGRCFTFRIVSEERGKKRKGGEGGGMMAADHLFDIYLSRKAVHAWMGIQQRCGGRG